MPSATSTGTEGPQAANNPSTIAEITSSSVRKASNTLVGGLLASEKSMKPFRSPMTVRSTHTASLSSANMGAETPTKQSLSSFPISSNVTIARPKVTPYRPIPSKSSNSANPALNKPFRSPFASKSISHSSPMQSSSSAMSSLQLSTALPAIERRLAMLKNARRHIDAKKKGLETADNTTHILELSQKWLQAGREAAEMLLEITKDHYSEPQQGGSGGFGEFGGSSNWGWATTDDGSEAIRSRMEDDLDDMSERDREKAIRAIDQDEERYPLPKSPEDFFKRTNIVNTKAEYGNQGSVKPKNDNTSHVYSLAQDQSLRESASPASPNQNDTESFDDPMNRGMAKMLTQCGVK